MRKILDNAEQDTLNRLSYFLISKGIECDVRISDLGISALWIIDDDQIPNAKRLMEAYLLDPDSSTFDAKKPPLIRELKQPKVIDVRTEVFSPGGISNIGNYTLYIILFSCAVTILYWNRMGMEFVGNLFFANFYGIPEIKSGQIWRLVTPIFLHGDFLHLLFNMLWMYQLGNQIEIHKGPKYYTTLIVIFAVLCNVSQYLVSGPLFLGMSGVIYGFLGYMWMETKYSPTSKFNLNEQTVFFMGIWLVVCMTGMVGNVANTQHIVGMVSGTAWGFYTSGGLKNWNRQRKL